MIHITFKAIGVLSGMIMDLEVATSMALACNWTSRGDKDSIVVGNVWGFMGGRKMKLPTCPICALFFDMALEHANTLVQQTQQELRESL